LGGVPPEVALAINYNEAMHGLGIDPSKIPEDQVANVRRTIHLTMANLRPVLAGLVAADDAANPRFGDPVVIKQAGVKISASFPQDPIEAQQNAMLAVQGMVAGALQQDPSADQNAAINAWHNVAGPYVRAANLYQAIRGDPEEGMTDMKNPKSPDEAWFSPTHWVEEAQALRDIGELLRSI